MKSDDEDAVRRSRVQAALATAAASIVVIGAVGVLATYSVHRGSPGIALANASGSRTSGSADDANRDAARAEAQALLDATPLPDGAVPVDASPSRVLDHYDQGGPLDQDTTLDRVAWWTVPVTASDFAAYVAEHVPPGFTKTGSLSGTFTDTHAGTSVDYTEQEFTGPGTDAYTPPQLWLTWAAVDGGTAVRAEVYVGARWPRSASSYLSGRITRVDVRITGPKKAAVSTSYTRHATIRRLKTVFNDLPGALHDEGEDLVMSCPIGPMPTTTVVFHLAAGGVVRARGSYAGCGGGLVVWHDGRRVLPPLDPDDFVSGVAAIVK